MGPYGGYYDPTSLYGSPTDYSTSPIVGGPGGYLANNQQAAFMRFLGPQAFGNDPYGQFLRSTAYNLARQGFGSAAATNPNLGFGYGEQDYLKGFGPDFFRQQFLRMAPEQRGINAPRFGGGAVRWSRM